MYKTALWDCSLINHHKDLKLKCFNIKDNFALPRFKTPFPSKGCVFASFFLTTNLTILLCLSHSCHTQPLTPLHSLKLLQKISLNHLYHPTEFQVSDKQFMRKQQIPTDTQLYVKAKCYPYIDTAERLTTLHPHPPLHGPNSPSPQPLCLPLYFGKRL